jgi:hypothetical protein
MAPAVARLASEYGPKGLRIVAPTQLYGYVQRGEEAAPEQETAYIRQVKEFEGLEVVIDSELFRNLGASTTPTIVLVDGRGIVRFYHPGQMTYQELAPKIEEMMRLARAAAAS